MRSSYSKDEFLIAAARKKPRWQQLIDNLPTMDLDEISNLAEPIWVREALAILKQTGGIGQKERIRNILLNAIEADRQAEHVAKPQHQVRTWRGSTSLIDGDNPYTNSSIGWSIELCENESFLIGPENIILIGGDGLLRVSDANMLKLVATSEFTNYMSSDEYRAFHQNQLNHKF